MSANNVQPVRLAAAARAAPRFLVLSLRTAVRRQSRRQNGCGGL